MKSPLYITILIFLGFCSCNEGDRKNFANLLIVEKQNLLNELIDSLRIENQDYLAEYDSFYNMAMPPCGPFYPIVINQNKKGKVMIKNEIAIGKIQSSILTHFMTNADNNSNDNFPSYDIYYKKNQINYCQQIKGEIQTLKNQNADIALINFKENQILEHKSILKYFNLLKTTFIKKIDYSAHIRLDYHTNIKTNILDSALYSYYELRNNLSKKYFHKTYLEVFYDNKTTPDSTNILKMDFLKWVFPVQILDLPYMKENNLRHYFIPPQVEIIPVEIQD